MSRVNAKLAAAAALTALAMSAPASAEVVWRGDFETGDHSQYSKQQVMGADRIQVVDSPVRQGQHALRVEVRPGDDPINASGNRNELVRFDGASEGTEFYYGWSTLFPEDYPMVPNWQVFMQWHHSGNNGAPPVRFALGCSANDCGAPMPDTLFFIVNGKNVWMKTPVTRGEWHDFVLHIKWSANPGVGFVELWYDGELVVPKTHIRTMFSSGDTNYLKMGLYRDEAVRQTQVLYQDGLVQATTLEEALQPQLGAPTEEPSEETPPVAGGEDTPPGEQPGTTEPPLGSTPGTGAEPGVGDGVAQAPVVLPGGTNATAKPPAAGGCSASAASVAPLGLLLSAAALRRRTPRRRE